MIKYSVDLKMYNLEEAVDYYDRKMLSLVVTICFICNLGTFL